MTMATAQTWSEPHWEWFREDYSRKRQLTWHVTLSEPANLQIVTPNKASIEITADHNWADWPESEAQSTLLWKFSGIYLAILAKRQSSAESINIFYESLARYLLSPEAESTLSRLTSRDHLTAELLQSSLFLLTFEDFNCKHLASRLIEELLLWTVRPDSIRTNNHGLMLANAALHAHAAISASPDLQQTLENRLTQIIEAAFDSSGLCVENSPAYHAFHLRYLRELQISSDHPLSPLRPLNPIFDSILKRGTKSLESTRLPSGKLPPLGDGNFINGAKPHQPQARHFSADSGFYCKRSRNFYFSMKCGQSSIVHKHMDDNSIFVECFGETVFTDGGIYNYDWKDPFTLAVKSQRGHSMPRFTKFDEIYPATFYRMDAPPRVEGRLCYEQEDDLERISGVSAIDKHYITKRLVEIHRNKSLVISDSFSSSDSAEASIRFLTPGHFSLEIASPQKIILTGEHVECELVTSGEFFSFIRGERTASRIDGWVATALNEIAPAWAIDIRPTDTDKITVTTAKFRPRF